MDDTLDLSSVKGPNLTGRLETLLRRNIAEGVWGVKDLLPTELDIAEEVGVSRNTVRTALQRLVNDGLLVRVKGHGTFVTPPPVAVSVAARVRQTLHAAMPTPVSRIVRDEYGTPPATVAAAFGLAADEELYYLERIRYQLADGGQPVMYHYAWLRPEYAGAIDKPRLTLGRLQDQLRDSFGLVPSRITEGLSAGIANATEARELDIAVGSPLLLLSESRFDHDDRLYTLARYSIVPRFLRLEFEHLPGPLD